MACWTPRPPLNPPLSPLFPPPGEFRKEPAGPRLPMPAELLEKPPLAGSRDIPPARIAGFPAAEERPGPLWIPAFPMFPVILPPLPEMGWELLPRRADGTPSP